MYNYINFVVSDLGYSRSRTFPEFRCCILQRWV